MVVLGPQESIWVSPLPLSLIQATIFSARFKKDKIMDLELRVELQRIIRELQSTKEWEAIWEEIRQQILQRIRMAQTPQDAMQVKYQLEAVDVLIHQIEQTVNRK